MVMRAAALALMLSAAPALALAPPMPPYCEDADGTGWYYNPFQPGLVYAFDYAREDSYVLFCQSGRAIRITEAEGSTITPVETLVIEAQESVRTYGISDLVRVLRGAGHRAQNVPLDQARCVCDAVTGN